MIQEPQTVADWVHELRLRAGETWEQRVEAWQRAVQALPRSYKLWAVLLGEAVERCLGRRAGGTEEHEVNALFEQSLMALSTMPRLWIRYAAFLERRGRVTDTRRCYDRALQAVAITQHHLLWPPYLAFADQCRAAGLVDTAIHIRTRHLQLQPGSTEELLDLLQDEGRYNNMVTVLIRCIDHPDYQSARGRSKRELWGDLCVALARQTNTAVDVEAVLRSGLERFSDNVGSLWTALAEYTLAQGQFERTRHIYEEAVRVVQTPEDFALVFDSYAQFEETMIATKLRMLEETTEIEKDQVYGIAVDDIDLRLRRLDHLLTRRSLLLSDVLLRQRPHHIPYWLERSAIFRQRKDVAGVCSVLADAVTAVDPHLASGGSTAQLWITYSQTYASHGDAPAARSILERATAASFTHVEDLASVWCAWAEMEVQLGNAEQAIALLGQATAPPSKDETDRVRQRVHKSTRMWAMLSDLEESLGTVDTVKAVYDQAMALRVASTRMVLNYAAYLQRHKRWEGAFRVYERGIGLMSYPDHVPLWLTYIHTLTHRFQGTKLERTRELFEEALRSMPEHAQELRSIYVLYARYEEASGTPKRAMRVYARAARNVADEHKHDMYMLYIGRATHLYGAVAARAVYEEAMVELPDASVQGLAMQYAKVELALGEIDRVRAIYTYAAPLAHPRAASAFADQWKAFEAEYGDEETYRRMLRVLKHAEAKHAYASFEPAPAPAPPVLEPTVVEQTLLQENPEEIEIDFDDDMNDGDTTIDVEEKQVPAKVFGEIGEGSALERLKRQRVS